MHRIIPMTLLLLANLTTYGHAESLSLGMNDYSVQLVFTKTVDQGPADSIIALSKKVFLPVDSITRSIYAFQ